MHLLFTVLTGKRKTFFCIAFNFYISFCEGFLDHVTVLIGIAVNGVATAGVINQPFHGYIPEDPKYAYGCPRAIWGVLGLGRLPKYNSYPFPKQALVFMCLQYKSFENTVGKGKIALNMQFFHFPQCFLFIWRTFCHFHHI